MSGLERFEREDMDLDERVDLLLDSRWGHELKAAEAKGLAAYFDVYKVKRDAHILTEGANEAYLALIIEGAASVYKHDDADKLKEIAKLSKGQSFGEMSLVDGLPRSATIKVTKHLTLLVLKREKFLILLEQRPELAAPILLQICKLLSARLRQTSGKLIEFL